MIRLLSILLALTLAACGHIEENQDMNIIRVNITVYDPAIPGTKVLRYATKGHTTKPTDTPPSTRYLGLLTDPGTYSQMMFAEGTTSGQSEVGSGQIGLYNKDGVLNALLDYGVAGREIVIEEVNAAGTLLDSHTLTMEQPVFDGTLVTIRIRDRQAELDVPLQANKYLGNNALPDGVEGVGDLKDQPKPLAFGSPKNITPRMVNTSKLILQYNDGPAKGDALYDKGVLITKGVDYASLADVVATEPAPGTWRDYPAGGYARLGSSPVGQFTMDVTEGAAAADRTAAQIAKRMFLHAPTVTTADLTAQDFIDLDGLNSEEAAFYTSGETTIKAALSKVLGSVGAWSGFDVAGKFGVGRLNAPGGTPILALKTKQILSIERVATNDEGRGVPAWSVAVNYDKNNTVQDAGNLAGSIGNSWEEGNLPSYSTWFKCIFGNGVFLAFTQIWPNAYYVTSPDGINWTAGPNGSLYIPQAIAYGNGKFLAIHKYDSSNAWLTASHSTDGRTWTLATGINSVPRESFGAAVKLVYGNGHFVGISTGGYDVPTGKDTTFAIYSHDDGATWGRTVLTIGPGTFNSPGYSNIAFGNGVFVAIGANGYVSTSPDGVTWTPRTSAHPASSLERIDYGNGLFVVIGASNCLSMTSPDGITWTPRVIPATGTTFSSLKYGDNRFVAVGTGQIVLTSFDGVNWMVKTLPSSQAFNSIGYGNGQFVMLGGGTNIVASWGTVASSAKGQRLSKEYRTVSALDAVVKTVHLTSPALTVDTLLISAAAAQAEADRKLTLYGVRRDPLKIRVNRSVIKVPLKIGGELALTYPLYGYEGSKQAVIMGFFRDLKTRDIIIYTWG